MTEQVKTQPIFGAAAITPSDSAVAAGDTVPGLQFAIVCGTAGNVKVRFYDGSTLTFSVAVGTLFLPWAVSQVFITGTTAVASYYNLR